MASVYTRVSSARNIFTANPAYIYLVEFYCFYHMVLTVFLKFSVAHVSISSLLPTEFDLEIFDLAAFVNLSSCKKYIIGSH